MFRVIALAVVLFTASGASAQNCLPKPSAVAWLDWFSNSPSSCGRVDYLFYPKQEAWHCGGDYILSFPPDWRHQSGTITGRLWYFEWYDWGSYRLWPDSTLFCRCNVASCQVRAWQ